MKKFLYFIVTILIIALVYAIWQFQKQTSETQEQALAQPETSVSAQITENCTCKSECLCPEDEQDCECTQTKSTCECTQEDGSIAIIESVETNNVDIEETNPDETADEDETIINE